MSFTNITDEELLGMGVTGLPDTPGLTTEEMQAQFDEYSVFLKDKFKGLIAELEATTAALSIGADVPENITAEGNIQSILEGLRDYVDATVVALGTGDMARGIYDPDRDGIIAPEQGGTGLTSLQAVRNAMGLGDTTEALPIANGGTGQTTAAGIRNALGLGNTTDALPLANGGTGASTAIEALKNLGLYQYFVSNNNIEPTTTAANHHNVGDFIVYDSSKKFAKVTAEINIGDTITHGTNVINEPIGAELTNMKATFQDGVETVYEATDLAGVTPSSSTPDAIATAIGNLRKTPYTETYTFPSGDTGGTKDFGVPHNIRKVNASNVYTKGKTDAESVTWITQRVGVGGGTTTAVPGSTFVAFIDATNLVSLKCIHMYIRPDNVNCVKLISYLDSNRNYLTQHDYVSLNGVYYPPSNAKLAEISVQAPETILADAYLRFDATYRAKILR